MLKKSPVLALALCTAAFGLDEYLPIGQRIMQVTTGYEAHSLRGQYDEEWTLDEDWFPNHRLEERKSFIPLEGKFGLFEGLEGSIALKYAVEDGAGENGFTRPTFGLKYAYLPLGVGAFAGITLPFSMEDVFLEDEKATFTVGALYGKTFPYAELLAQASYAFDTEDEAKRKTDKAEVLVKPEASLYPVALSRRKLYLGLSAGLRYAWFTALAVDGKTQGGDANLLSLEPGVRLSFRRMVAMEVKAPFTVTGENRPGSYGVEARLFFTLDEGLYNSL